MFLNKIVDKLLVQTKLIFLKFFCKVKIDYFKEMLIDISKNNSTYKNAF